VKSKWFSPRAIVLHIALLGWLGLCVAAAWWQVGRAVQGNSLSFMYSIEWPVFAVLGVLGWLAMLNMETITAGQEKARLEYEERMRAQAKAERAASAPEDATLSAYNDHLADLATRPKKKLWGH
jgi:hypothetical protein